ncbi:hypothetical protein P2P31_25100, partial [Escherichia coli]
AIITSFSSGNIAAFYPVQKCLLQPPAGCRGLAKHFRLILNPCVILLLHTNAGVGSGVNNNAVIRTFTQQAYSRSGPECNKS